MVEATGVEPVSKKLFMTVSTSLVYLQRVPRTQADKQAVWSVAS